MDSSAQPGASAGSVATNADLDSPHGLSVGPDGSLYIADTMHHLVRRVSLDGRIETVAGGGSPAGGIGDNGPATSAKLFQPIDVAVAPDGRMFISDSNHNRVRLVRPDGVISTFAGTGTFSLANDGGPATMSGLGDPTGLAFDPSDGSLYLAETLRDSIRRIDASGIITTFAGTGAAGSSEEGTIAGAGTLRRPFSVAVGPGSKIFVADSGNHRIRRIASSMPGFATTDFLVATPEGVHRFDTQGRHLQSFDALTGNPTYSFNYDTQGRLSSVEDTFSNVTTIEYAGGDPSAIVSPFGLRTTLQTNANGYLSEVDNPAAEAVAMTYGSGGLLASFTTPSGASQFTYDNLGRLTLDQGPEGFSVALDRTELDDGFEVTATTAEGVDTTYRWVRVGSGGSRRSVIRDSGAIATSTTGTTGITRLVAPDGTVTETTIGGDPRWGLMLPIARRVQVTMPSGASSSVAMNRTVTLADAGNPLSLLTQTDTGTSATRTYTTAYNAATDTVTSTSPEGRKKRSRLLNGIGL